LLRPSEMTEPLTESPDFGNLEGDDVETVAREIASRGAGSLDGLGMLFFDPAIRHIFGGESPGASHLLADDDGIERLIDRLEELDDEVGLDC
jgi:hypothetical protein